MSENANAVLAKLWNKGEPDTADEESIPEELRLSISRAVNSSFKLFRYILPSQLLAKLEDPSRHALVLQVQSQLPGSFDARSFCKAHITQFDQDNHHVLGGSDDPGVGNIWRYPQIDEQWVSKGRRRKSGGADLLSVLSYAQSHPEHVELLLRLTLSAIAERLSKTRILYPRPNRIALDVLEDVIRKFLSPHTGGRRLQAIAAALFDTIGKRFKLFDGVRVGHINKSDAARNDVADLDCVDAEGTTVISVEVKDRDLSVREVNDTLKVARDRGVAEIIYLIRGAVVPSEREAYVDLKRRQFTAGHNVYDIQFDLLLHTCLILFGERGRLELLITIGSRVDELGELSDRQAWQLELLAV